MIRRELTVTDDVSSAKGKDFFLDESESVSVFSVGMIITRFQLCFH